MLVRKPLGSLSDTQSWLVLPIPVFGVDVGRVFKVDTSVSPYDGDRQPPTAVLVSRILRRGRRAAVDSCGGDQKACLQYFPFGQFNPRR